MRYDLLGKRFGRLVPPEIVQAGHNSKWLCKCDCGKQKIVFTNNLIRGVSKSCGCLARELTVKRNSGLPGVAGFRSLRGNYRRGAIRRGHLWELTDDDCFKLFQSDCIYCGAAPNQIYRTGSWNGTFVYNGLDRVDNEKGYTTANTVACCGTCNLAKHTTPDTEFRDWIKRAYEYQNRIHK